MIHFAKSPCIYALTLDAASTCCAQYAKLAALRAVLCRAQIEAEMDAGRGAEGWIVGYRSKRALPIVASLSCLISSHPPQPAQAVVLTFYFCPHLSPAAKSSIPSAPRPLVNGPSPAPRASHQCTSTPTGHPALDIVLLATFTDSGPASPPRPPSSNPSRAASPAPLRRPPS